MQICGDAATEFAPALRSLAGRLAGRPEAAIVATCNRTELYVSGEPAAVPEAIAWLAAHGRVPVDTLRAHAYMGSAYLYTLDDLGASVQRAGAARQAAVQAAQAIVEHGVGDFERWLERRQAVPLIQALNARAEAWRVAELARARRRLARGDDLESVMQGLGVALERKLLHGARRSLRTSPGVASDPLVQTVERLFLRGGVAGSPGGG